MREQSVPGSPSPPPSRAWAQGYVLGEGNTTMPNQQVYSESYSKYYGGYKTFISAASTIQAGKTIPLLVFLERSIVSMECLKMSLVFLILTLPFSLSNVNKSGSGNIKLLDGKYAHCSNNSECPTWFICNSTNACQCGNEHDGIIVCNDKRLTSAVLICYCVTHDKVSKSTFLGSCFYNCAYRDTRIVYEELPADSEMPSICDNFNRVGLLCGDCEEGYSPLVLSYNLSCVKCPDGHKNWWKFILAGFVPLTFFYFFVVLFNVNVTTSRLYGVVWFSQALAMPALVRIALFTVHSEHPNFLKTVKVFTLFYSFWNLDIFHSVLPDICLNVTTLQALALDYLVAFYPFLLILISYMIIKLYDSQIRFMIIIWKPFRALLANFRQSMDVRTSVIDSFATFFFLSYIKVVSITNDLLIPTQIYQLGSNISTFGLYYSPSVVYFGEEHLPYAILAIFILAIFVCVPTVTLLLYPFQFFQRFLSLFPFNWHFLRAFVDAFQGNYKDRTEPGTFDWRWLSAMQLLLRPLLFVVYTTTLSMIFFVFATITLVLVLIILVNVQPFKNAIVRYSSTDSIFLILLSLSFISIIGIDVISTENISLLHTAFTAFVLLSIVVPLFYIASFIMFWLIIKIKRIYQLVYRQRH